MPAMSHLELTYSGVLLAVLANQLCLPVPSVVFLMAAGALSAHGRMSAIVIALLSVPPCLAADGLWFWFGRQWGSRALRVLCRFTSDPRGHAENAHRKFRRYGMALLCVAKFFPGLDGLIPPLAGAEGVSLAGFLALDAVGSVLWSASYVALGYAFSDQLDLAIKWVNHFGTLLGIVIGLPIVLYAGWRGGALIQMIRKLRVCRISPAALYKKLKSKSKVAVLDLLEFDEDTDPNTPAAIPGAFRVDPTRLRESPRLFVPGDVQIVLYSSSERDLLSARVAIALQRIGIDNVWVLEGGLRAWREKDFPMSPSHDAPEAVAERVGVRLPAL
jgi:membrane protein DedA with SNARE-associated domain/rhodanese-related sulfurtransferase